MNWDTSHRMFQQKNTSSRGEKFWRSSLKHITNSMQQVVKMRDFQPTRNQRCTQVFHWKGALGERQRSKSALFWALVEYLGKKMEDFSLLTLWPDQSSYYANTSLIVRNNFFPQLANTIISYVYKRWDTKGAPRGWEKGTIKSFSNFCFNNLDSTSSTRMNK